MTYGYGAMHLSLNSAKGETSYGPRTLYDIPPPLKELFLRGFRGRKKGKLLTILNFTININEG